MIRRVRSVFAFSGDSEITVEVNPGDVDADSLRSLRDAGVNRISIGVQSFNDVILNFLGRRHTGLEGRRALEAARAAGFRNLSLDLIYGVPGQTPELWQDTLRCALGFDPEHLSCYELTVEAGTPMHGRVASGVCSTPGEEEGYRFFCLTSEVLERSGYIHYEVSNFARSDSLLSRHNHKYWNHTPYLGLGPAAHSFKGTRRWWNPRSLERYLGELEGGRPPLGGEEQLSAEALRLEALYFGFRTKKGIHLRDFACRYGFDLFREKETALRRLQREGFVTLEGDCLAPTRRGLALADQLCLL
jgi:oxygen-independent coproporphyrinogen-3 oxidase